VTRGFVSISLGNGESLIVRGSLRRWTRRLTRAKRRHRFVMLTETRTCNRLALHPNGWQMLMALASSEESET
jgi:hypothetical protein